MYPGSVLGMLKSIVFVAPTGPLTCACCCALSAETASVPSYTSRASRSDKVAPPVVLSTAVSTVIVDKSWRPSSASSWSLLRPRGLMAEKDFLTTTLPLACVRFRPGKTRLAERRGGRGAASPPAATSESRNPPQAGRARGPARNPSGIPHCTDLATNLSTPLIALGALLATEESHFQAFTGRGSHSFRSERGAATRRPNVPT